MSQPPGPKELALRAMREDKATRKPSKSELRGKIAKIKSTKPIIILLSVGFATGFISRPNRTADALVCGVIFADGWNDQPEGCKTLSLNQIPWVR